MFEIVYRITDKIQYLRTLNENSFDDGGDIEGFFEIRINDNSYGYYHANPLGDDEAGWYAISDWFNKLVLVYQKLSETNYVALNDTDSYNIWIEFKMDNGNLLLSIVEAEKEDGTAEIMLTPFEKFKYGEWSMITLKQTDFANELNAKISAYLDEINKINAKLLKNKNINALSRFISENKTPK